MLLGKVSNATGGGCVKRIYYASLYKSHSNEHCKKVTISDEYNL